ncbi:helix-turn-helix domain-containing protein [Streptomyces sp. NPDC059096]|uniref:helix-turn-helix domain-containing protein n=1 Tax=Streptomyces sp. NPDC059096 TaxID=3346727 RepID=UPI00369AC7ED
MSSDAREWVWEHSSSRGNARLVLLSIADRVADEQCISWASLSSLAKRTRASLSTVREAIERLVDSDELEQLDDLTGPQGSTVYRLPLAAVAVAAAARDQDADADSTDDTDASVDEPESPPAVRISALRRYGIRLREVPVSLEGCRKPAVPESGRSRRKPAPRGTGNRHGGVPKTGTQNRSEPDKNRRYSSGGGAVTPAAEWEVDPDTHTWTRQQGHLDRLGEEGLALADAKWRAHRAGHPPRPAGVWAADWRSWIAREHAPSRPRLRALPGGAGDGPAPAGGMTRAEAHMAALLAALDEPTGTEG